MSVFFRTGKSKGSIRLNSHLTLPGLEGLTGPSWPVEVYRSNGLVCVIQIISLGHVT